MLLFRYKKFKIDRSVDTADSLERHRNCVCPPKWKIDNTRITTTFIFIFIFIFFPAAVTLYFSFFIMSLKLSYTSSSTSSWLHHTSYHIISHHITSQLLRSSEMKSWIEQFGRFILLREAQLIAKQYTKLLVALTLLVKLQNVHERKKILAFLNQTSCFKPWGKRANVVYILCSVFCILYSVFFA